MYTKRVIRVNEYVDADRRMIGISVIKWETASVRLGSESNISAKYRSFFKGPSGSLLVVL